MSNKQAIQQSINENQLTFCACGCEVMGVVQCLECQEAQAAANAKAIDDFNDMCFRWDSAGMPWDVTL